VGIAQRGDGSSCRGELEAEQPSTDNERDNSFSVSGLFSILSSNFLGDSFPINLGMHSNFLLDTFPLYLEMYSNLSGGVF